MSDTLFQHVHAALGGKRNRRGWYDCDCPFCGKEAKRGQVHFSYSEMGYRCWVCCAAGNLSALAEHLRINPDRSLVQWQRREREPLPVARWRQNPTELLRRYQEHPDRYRAWRSYKPLSAATIDRYGFGLGRLPFQREGGEWYMSRQEWLIVPLWEAGHLVGLRGRNLGNDGPKWLSAAGTNYTLWGVDYVRAGSITWLCENYVDAAWLMQERPTDYAVAIGGATTWQASWADMLAGRKPQTVIVALDNDLPGQAVGEFRRQLEAEWVSERNSEPPTANGPRIANALRSAGVNAVLFQWPSEAPHKAGVDWLLHRRRQILPGSRDQSERPDFV